MANILEFISQFGNSGVARANRFRVSFNLPRGIDNEYFTNTSSAIGEIQGVQNELNRTGGIDLMCHSCTLPSRELQSFDLQQMGPPHRMPNTVSYMPITFTFYSNGNLSSRRYFEVWQTAVHNISSNTFNFYNEYVSTIRIGILDTENRETYSVRIWEAWPSSIAGVDYAYGSNNSPQSFVVTMQYKYWQAKHDDTRVSYTV
jgi:hypothetical protein